ncbi:alpha-L-rhamnosidase C-terminal domain-containing protein [Gracilibacillus salitolerans]|nr:alpha-L-rhamnosidase C-terminal domain-containing protein [Gracilibacillus salitolerans]
MLGIKIKEPGCRVIEIRPTLGDLEWVEGSFPTPYGTLTVKHEK